MSSFEIIQKERLRDKRRKKFVNRYVYELPNPLNSMEEWQRTFNRDLEELPLFELWQEKARVRLRVAYIDPLFQEYIFLGPGEYISEREWMFGRLAAIERELQARRQEAAGI